MDRAYLSWVDANGGQRLTWYTYVSGPISVSFEGALEVCANPIPANLVYGPVNVWAGGPPSVSPYLSVTDSAVLSFQTSVGSIIGLTIPGFKEALYLSDNQTVDPAQPDVIALIGYAIGYLVDGAGNPAATYIGGIRQNRRY